MVPQRLYWWGRERALSRAGVPLPVKSPPSLDRRNQHSGVIFQGALVFTTIRDRETLKKFHDFWIQLSPQDYEDRDRGRLPDSSVLPHPLRVLIYYLGSYLRLMFSGTVMYLDF